MNYSLLLYYKILYVTYVVFINRLMLICFMCIILFLLNSPCYYDLHNHYTMIQAHLIYFNSLY